MFFQRCTFLSPRKEEILPISLLLRFSGWIQIAGFPGKTLLQDYETTEGPLSQWNITVQVAAQGGLWPGPRSFVRKGDQLGACPASINT